MLIERYEEYYSPPHLPLPKIAYSLKTEQQFVTFLWLKLSKTILDSDIFFPHSLPPFTTLQKLIVDSEVRGTTPPSYCEVKWKWKWKWSEVKVNEFLVL